MERQRGQMDFPARCRYQFCDIQVYITSFYNDTLYPDVDFLRGENGIAKDPPAGNFLHFLLVQNEIMSQIDFADMLVGSKLLRRSRHQHLAIEKQIGTVCDA